MRVAVVGSRHFRDRKLFDEVLAVERDRIAAVVSGGAKGPDTWAEEWAKANGVPLRVFPADWERYGRKAGPIRNNEIVNNCDMVLAFWDGESRGAVDTMRKAEKQGKKVKLFVSKPQEGR